MGLGLPNTFIPRLRRAPPRPYKAASMHTQHLKFEHSEILKLEQTGDQPTPLGTDLDLCGTILGRPVRVQATTTSRRENQGLHQPGYWQDDFLANLDHAAKAMIQLQMSEYVGTWEFYGPEAVTQDIKISPADAPEPVQDAPKRQNRMRR